jgi:EpsI family protein
MASGAKNAIASLDRIGPAGLLASALAAGALLALWPSAASLVDVWNGIHDYAHGYLIAAVSVIWFAVEASRISTTTLRPDPLGCLVLLAVLFGWLVAFKANSLMAHQLLWPLAIWAAVLAGAGRVVAVRLAAPIGFLYFAMPIWEYFVPVLQRMCVFVTETTLAAAGIPATVNDNLVSIPEGSFQIVEGCSGKRYFIVALAVAVLATRVFRLNRGRGAALVAASAALALIANWLRILIVVVAGHLSDMQHYFVAVEHLTLGNAIFAVLLAGILLLARRLSHGHGTARHAANAIDPGGKPDRWPTALAFLLLGGAFAASQPAGTAVTGAAQLGPLPIAVDRWQGPLPASPAWMPAFKGRSGEYRASYSSAAGTVELYANVYDEQSQGQELVQYANTLLAPGNWHRPWSQESAILKTRAPLASFEARAADGALWLIAYLYDVDGWHTRHETLAQLAYGLHALRGPVASGLVALAVRCDADCRAARALAAAFWDDMSGPILGMYPDAGHDP